MITQNKTLSQMSFELANANHPYRKKVRQYAEGGKCYEKLYPADAKEITNLYIDYKGMDCVDIPIPKSVISSILGKRGNLGYSCHGCSHIISTELLNKYESDISEDIEDEIQYLRNESMQCDVEIASVNSGEFT